MKIILFLVIPVLIFITTHTASSAAAEEDPGDSYDRVLKRYVSEEGMVDYKALKGDKEFQRYIEYLFATDPDTLPSDKHRLAFWINAYNAFVLKGVLEEYPIESVLDVGWIPHSFFIWKKFKTQEGNITLRKIENKILREGFDEPRIHFAISCASMSCPKLRREAYRAEELDRQLDDQAVYFINNKKKNYLDRKNKTLYLSSVFEWYKEDFVEKGEKIQDYVIQYLNPEDAEFIRNNKADVEYLEYDWGLNDQNDKGKY
ncbi:MAG: DUF547 domain-containing protein [wastewater metagenome]|nr:DUF547 domain-containing protein [Candidatus Loosdrechtia aerotolerans]